ncbi:hypothetical protein ACOME3_002354 [Neoechinorhynchus agilis]
MEYCCAGGPLKLKTTNRVVRKRIKNEVIPVESTTAEPNKMTTTAIPMDGRTKAELRFELARQKRLAQQLNKKELKTHKQRVEEFNDKLEKLTEYNDIPKVSWTK